MGHMDWIMRAHGDGNSSNWKMMYSERTAMENALAHRWSMEICMKPIDELYRSQWKIKIGKIENQIKLWLPPITHQTANDSLFSTLMASLMAQTRTMKMQLHLPNQNIQKCLRDNQLELILLLHLSTSSVNVLWRSSTRIIHVCTAAILLNHINLFRRAAGSQEKCWYCFTSQSAFPCRRTDCLRTHTKRCICYICANRVMNGAGATLPRVSLSWNASNFLIRTTIGFVSLHCHFHSVLFFCPSVSLRIHLPVSENVGLSFVWQAASQFRTALNLLFYFIRDSNGIFVFAPHSRYGTFRTATRETSNQKKKRKQIK